MKRQLLPILGVAALGVASYASTLMRVEKNDGTIVDFDVDEVRQVFLLKSKLL